ncbi:MAG: sodium ion-translocating decarboxylase subunit beta, partial [Firmicutes bacterium]|nr:sodium ion-translocating decarboxylase subunit beta [Bacillota bacterium]
MRSSSGTDARSHSRRRKGRTTTDGLLTGIAGLEPGHVVMLLTGGLLIWLAITKGYEPTLLLPIGFGAILANIPSSAAVAPGGFLELLNRVGIATELFPILIFIAIGAMSDFAPLLQNPGLLLFGAAAQFGVFFTLVLAVLAGFDLREAAAIGIIGAADGPTSIYVATRFAPRLLGPITVAAYSYMSLVPIIQPAVVRALTSPRERRIRMTLDRRGVSRTTLVLFPIMVTLVAGLVAPI